MSEKNVRAVILSETSEGWWTEHRNYDLLFDPTLVEMVRKMHDLSIEEDDCHVEEMDKISDDFDAYLRDRYPTVSIDPFMAYSLRVECVPVGEKFRILETHVGEQIVLFSDEAWIE